MGKYLMRRKKKTMEISHSSSAAAAVGLGVKKSRTRARTSVAVLQSFSSSSSAPVPRIHRAVRRKQNACSLVGFDESTSVSSCSKKQRCTTNAAAVAARALNSFSYPNTRSRARGANFSRNPHGKEPKATVEKKAVGLREEKQEQEAMEVCCGETEAIFHDKQSRERNGRARTPSPGGGHCQSLEAPGSTTRSRRKRTETGTHAKEEQGRRRRRERGRETQEAAAAPSSHEMEDFFAGAEQQQHRFFIERYNYDPVNDVPLPGRYEWMRLKQ